MSIKVELYNELMEEFFSFYHNGILILDQDKNILCCNESATQIFHFEKETLEKNRVMSLIEGSSWEKFQIFLKAVESTYQRNWEFNVINGHNEIFPVNISGYLRNGYYVCIVKKEPEELLKLQENLITINNEMTNLHREVSRKNAELEEAQKKINLYCTELEKRNHLIQMELNMAKALQKVMLSNVISDYKNLQISKKYSPASSIGGDMYDVVTIEEDLVGIFIGDVAGHGVGAALVMAVLKNMFQNYYKEYKSPDELLHRLNTEFIKIFQSDTVDIFATAFYIMIDLKNHRITYSSAGHPFPYIFKESGENAELDLAGLPIGVIMDANYEARQTDVHSGDRLFLFTDGLEDYIKELGEHQYVTENFTWGNIIHCFTDLSTKLDNRNHKQVDDVSIMVVELK